MGQYIRRRFFRIVPLALFCAIVLFLFRKDFSGTAWFDFGAHVLFLQALFQDTYHGLNPVMWTLTVEMLFYALLPILLFWGRKKRWHFFLILLVLTVLNFWYRWYVVRFFPGWSQFERIFYSEQLWGRFDQFTLGIALGIAWLSKKDISKHVQKFSSFFMVIGILGFFLGMGIFAQFGGGFREILWMQLFLHSLISFSFALFLFGFLFAPEKLQRFFAPRFLLFAGMISYSIYLWHFPVLAIVHRVFPDPGKGFVISITGTILLSWLTFKWIEQPFLQKKEVSGRNH